MDGGKFYIAAGCKDIFKNDIEKPWEKAKHFRKKDVEGILQITLSNGVYVNTVNLRPRIQNQIRSMAAFSNPVFYKNQAMGLSKKTRELQLKILDCLCLGRDQTS